MSQPLTGVLNLSLVGGYVCIDFANTVHDCDATVVRDELQTYGDLVRWSRRVEAIDDEAAGRLLALATAQPRQAAAALDEAKTLRAVIFGIFSAISDGRDPEVTDLQQLSQAYGEAMRHAEIAGGSDTYIWRWIGDCDDPRRVLWPIAAAAVDLLTSSDAGRIRRCESHDCTWLFIDRSKNRSRRWCDMGSCGNRAKARRHYRRTREETPD